MSCNYFSNTWDNNFNTTPTPNPVPPANDPDRADLNNLISMLNNPSLLKEGAQGALYALLSLAAMTVQQKEVKVRSEMAQQNASLTLAQGEIAKGQADAMKTSAYAAAASSVGAGLITVGGAAYSGYKMVDEEQGIRALDQEDHNVAGTAGTANANKTPEQRIQEEKERATNKQLKMTKYNEKLQLTHTLTKSASEVTSSFSQINSANANASKTLLETSGQQLNQASSELQSNQKTAGEVADQLTQLLTLSGNLAKAAVGR